MIKALVTLLEKRYSTEHAKTVAWWLLEKVTKKSRLTLITSNYQLSDDEKKLLDQWLKEHLKDNKPLQYILETVPFGPLELTVAPPVLIPRPETEQWCARVIKNLSRVKNKSFTILDMCTGSGAIGLWLAKEFPKAHIYAVDISEQALRCAENNAQKNNINNVRYIQSDLFSEVAHNLRFDIIFSNPPYVSEDEWKTMNPTITEWEDKKAFVAQNEGLALIQKIIKQSSTFLNQGSPLLIEIGHLQGKKVAELFAAHRFTNVHIIQDDAGKDRLVAGVYIS